MRRDRIRLRLRPAMAALPALALLTGCVERRYTIRTDPPGALVFVNSEELGPSPVSRPFTYYGHREIVVVADGYQTERRIVPVRAPWYDNFLTEFFTENLLPWTIRDEREIVIPMKRTEPVSPDVLVERAQGLRAKGQAAPPPRRRGLLAWLGF